MSTGIERLLYYEREYLRSFDLTAEQTYHMEMRRRLNLALHLWGIVEGLELLQGDVIPGASTQFYVSPGMAIDAYGREIIVPTIQLLSDYLGTSSISGGGLYSVWIGHKREPATPPEAGYRICDLKDQFTRWRESFQISILDQTTGNPNPIQVPDLLDDLPDDPKKFPWLIRLGTIVLDPSRTITSATNEDRNRYIGLRAERIVAPRDLIHDATSKFDVLQQNSALVPPTSISVEANLFAEQNLIVGDDFSVDKSKIKPQPQAAPPPFPSATGNLKVRSDLFLDGSLYSNVDGDWLSISEYIKRFTPDVLTGIRPITFPSQSDPPQANDTLSFTVASDRLSSISKAHGTVSIASVQWNTRQELNSIIQSPDQALFQITEVAVTPKASPANSCDVAVKWVVGPTLHNTGKFESAIVAMSIAYVVVCYP